MVGHTSLPQYTHSSFLCPSLFSPFSLWLRPLCFQAAMFFFFFCYHQRDKWETRDGRKPWGSCPHIIATPFISSAHSLPILHLSVFLSDSWQPVGYIGHANPSAYICQLTWENTHSPLHTDLNMAVTCMLQLRLFCGISGCFEPKRHIVRSLLPTELCVNGAAHLQKDRDRLESSRAAAIKLNIKRLQRVRRNWSR